MAAIVPAKVETPWWDRERSDRERAEGARLALYRQAYGRLLAVAPSVPERTAERVALAVALRGLVEAVDGDPSKVRAPKRGEAMAPRARSDVYFEVRFGLRELLLQADTRGERGGLVRAIRALLDAESGTRGTPEPEGVSALRGDARRRAGHRPGRRL